MAAPRGLVAGVDFSEAELPPLALFLLGRWQRAPAGAPVRQGVGEAVERAPIERPPGTQPIFGLTREGLFDRSVVAGDQHGEVAAEGPIRIEGVAAGQVEHQRVRAEGSAHRVPQARDDPALTEVVVHDEHAARFQPLLHLVHRLLGEQEAFEADVAVAAVQDERVDQGVDDRVVLLVAGAQVVAAVVEVHEHARVVVRLVGMVLLAEPLNHGIDLDGIHAHSASIGITNVERSRAAETDDEQQRGIR